MPELAGEFAKGRLQDGLVNGDHAGPRAEVDRIGIGQPFERGHHPVGHLAVLRLGPLGFHVLDREHAQSSGRRHQQEQRHRDRARKAEVPALGANPFSYDLFHPVS
ncbi:hypothetical protein H7F50_05820 [Novosphingobium flavum]|uniref:Uncharacterized protein n=1 Tax=Novosphingobium aerophilum TaxID=2839843 RepID=A0A7X1F6H8_9SPHN|nr:hypothetical protein [Novosphingobium aerophilum]MBC2651268.1 hypothetical protein [Novosphingobium aerophilum]MBC2661266.1 hypothetical protein [Novosphingobium aerophilum]